MTSKYGGKIDRGMLEAIFFTSPRPISEDRLAAILNMPKNVMREYLESFIKEFNEKHKGVKIVKSKRHYYLKIEPKYTDIVAKIIEPPPLNNRQKMIIAYLYKHKEALLRELKNIFGNAVYRDVKKLRRWGFVSVSSRDGKKTVSLRNEAEAYIIRRRGKIAYRGDSNQ